VIASLRLPETTFIIPLRVDSYQRAWNTALVTAYLTTLLDANVVIQEVDVEPRFPQLASRVFAQLLPPDAKLEYRFVPEARRDGVFHRTRTLNDMILRAATPVIVNYDADVVLPVESYHAAVSLLLDSGSDLVYPYSFGHEVQRRVSLDRATRSAFVIQGYSLTVLESVSVCDRAEFGFCQFFRRPAYLAGYLENENFVSYGPEDMERPYRFASLGYAVSRVDGPVYHLEHPRTHNSTPENPFMQSNVRLWRNIQELSPDNLVDYYERQPYVWERRNS
jgi:hypothetical protein